MKQWAKRYTKAREGQVSIIDDGPDEKQRAHMEAAFRLGALLCLPLTHDRRRVVLPIVLAHGVFARELLAHEDGSRCRNICNICARRTHELG